MTLDELYRDKGKYTMEIQVAQAKLQEVDKNIIKILNAQSKESNAEPA